MSDDPLANDEDNLATIPPSLPEPPSELNITPPSDAAGTGSSVPPEPDGKNSGIAKPILSLSQFAALIFLLLAIAGAVYLSSRYVPRTDPNAPPEVIIVQLNDIYRLDAVRAGKRGGLARVVTLLRQLKTKHPNVPVIVLHAGDFLAPSLESDLFNGTQMINAMNFINEVAPLYVVPGNHEFDYSDKKKSYLADAILQSKFPWVVANLEQTNSILPELRSNVRPHLLVTVGKVKLGIFGLTIDAAHENADRPYAPISGDYANIARREIEQLESEGADLIVGLTHLNMGDDSELAKLRQQHPKFLWIAGGHEHSVDRKASWPGAALITKGDSNARTVWKVSVVMKGENAEVHEDKVVIDEKIEPDADFKRNIEDLYWYKVRNERPYLDLPVAPVAAPSGNCYDGTEEAVRERESDWGDFLTDKMRDAYKGTDVAVLNGGSIRIDDSICNNIRFEDLERTFAFDTQIVLVKLTGKDLREQLLESSVGSKRGDGRFLQVSGVSFRRVLVPNASPKIEDIQVQTAKGWTPLDDAKSYVVAVSKYMFECGDNYKFRQFVTEFVPPGPDLRAVTYSALTAQAQGKPSPTLNRIIDLPEYTKPFVTLTPNWQGLDADHRACP